MTTSETLITSYFKYTNPLDPLNSSIFEINGLNNDVINWWTWSANKLTINTGHNYECIGECIGVDRFFYLSSTDIYYPPSFFGTTSSKIIYMLHIPKKFRTSNIINKFT